MYYITLTVTVKKIQIRQFSSLLNPRYISFLAFHDGLNAKFLGQIKDASSPLKPLFALVIFKSGPEHIDCNRSLRKKRREILR